MKTHKFSETIRKNWPKTKQELEKGVQNVRTAIVQGEKQLRSFSEKSLTSFKRSWPKTRQDLERGLESVQRAIQQGEKQVRILSEKGARNSKKLALSLKREKLYHDLGKAVATSAPSGWTQNKTIESLLSEVETISQEIKKLSGK